MTSQTDNDCSWNDRQKNPPPDEVQPPGSKLNYSLFKRSLDSLCNTLQDDSKLAESAALLSRLMARRANSFRGQKMFQDLKKIRTALCRYHEVNIVSTSARMQGLVSNESVPVRQSFNYFLMRLQITVKILLRIYLCSSRASKICFQLMKMNHFMEINILIISILAEITASCYTVMKSITTFLGVILPLKDDLPKSLVKNSNNDDFRDILSSDREVLNSIFSKRSRPVAPKPINVVKSLMDFSDDEEKEDVSLLPATNVKFESEATQKRIKSKVIDIGEAISRSSFENKKRKK